MGQRKVEGSGPQRGELFTVAVVTPRRRLSRKPSSYQLGGRFAGADVEEHRGRDEADDLAAKTAAKNTLREKLVHE